jgi:hypothetical protein
MEDKGALLTVAIPLVAFKIWFAILLLLYAPTRDTALWIAATHWTLLVVFGFIIAAGIPTYRLLKARAKRRKLVRSEFIVEPTATQCSGLWETVSRLEGE